MIRNRILIAKRFKKKYYLTVKFVFINIVREIKRVIIEDDYKSPYLICKIKA